MSHTKTEAHIEAPCLWWIWQGLFFCPMIDRIRGLRRPPAEGELRISVAESFAKAFFHVKKISEKTKKPLDSATIKIYTVYTIDTVHTIHTIYNAYVIYTVSITYNKNPLPPTKQKQGIVTSNHHSHRELIIFYQLFPVKAR